MVKQFGYTRMIKRFKSWVIYCPREYFTSLFIFAILIVYTTLVYDLAYNKATKDMIELELEQRIEQE